MRTRWVVVGIAALALVACSPRVSGVYVAHDASQVAMVQIVEGDGGKLSGRIEQVSLDDSGETSSDSIPLDGEVDGRQAIFRARGFLASTSLTGQFESGRLVLSGAGRSQTFRKANLDAFEREVEGLRGRGREAAEAKRVQMAHAALAKGATILADLDRATPELMRRVALIRQHFGEVNDALRQSEQKAEELGRAGRSAEAGQAYARSGALQAERARTQTLFVGLRQSVNAKVKDAVSATTEVRKLCGAASKARYAELCTALEAQDERLRHIASTLTPEFESAATAYGS